MSGQYGVAEQLEITRNEHIEFFGDEDFMKLSAKIASSAVLHLIS